MANISNINFTKHYFIVPSNIYEKFCHFPTVTMIYTQSSVDVGLYGHRSGNEFKTRTYFRILFDILLTVHLSTFMSVINQLDAQYFCFTISLFHASTCFEHICSSSGGQNCITQPLVSSHLLVHRLREDCSPPSTCAPDGHL